MEKRTQKRKNSTLRCWDRYWEKKWEENRKKQLTVSRNYGIIKAQKREKRGR